jgi:hypothetical protein
MYAGHKRRITGHNSIEKKNNIDEAPSACFACFVQN